MEEKNEVFSMVLRCRSTRIGISCGSFVMQRQGRERGGEENPRRRGEQGVVVVSFEIK